MAVEGVAGGASPQWLLHPHHLLYNFLAYAAFCLVTAAGAQPRALLVMQWLSSLLATLGLRLFYGVLRGIGLSSPAALAGSVLLGFSYGYWHFATTGDTTMAATVSLIAELAVAVRYLRSSSSLALPAVMGGLQALSFSCTNDGRLRTGCSVARLARRPSSRRSDPLSGVRGDRGSADRRRLRDLCRHHPRRAHASAILLLAVLLFRPGPAHRLLRRVRLVRSLEPTGQCACLARDVRRLSTGPARRGERAMEGSVLPRRPCAPLRDRRCLAQPDRRRAERVGDPARITGFLASAARRGLHLVGCRQCALLGDGPARLVLARRRRCRPAWPGEQ